MSLKDKISSPLEAGTSLLDAHHLPPHIGPALEYASSRLARRSLHLTLVVARRDYQLPCVSQPVPVSACASPYSPALSTPSTPGSPPPLTPSRFHFASSSVSAIKSLVRSGSSLDSVSTKSSESLRSAVSSPSLDSPGFRSRWFFSSATQAPSQPMTPCTPSSVLSDASGPLPQSSFGLVLIHSPDITAREERTLRRTLVKAEHKFGVGATWLAPALSPATCGLTKHLIHNSVAQNEVLFSSEGLTLVSLDRLYSLKSALSCYTKTQSPMRLEDAVDELRRFVLANNGIKVTKADLLRSYDWMSVSNPAIASLDRMYRRAYGGPNSIGAISGMPRECAPKSWEPVIRVDDGGDGSSDVRFEEEPLGADQIGVALTTPERGEVPKPPSPRGPVLKIQTSFESKPALKSGGLKPENDDDDEGDRTARPSDAHNGLLRPWPSSSIDQILSANTLSPARNSMQRGPMTPNGYDDISPVTRGEWGFLMVDNAFQGGRTVAIETW